jgi:hypothetical protein
MKKYNYSEINNNFSLIFETALKEEVIIKRNDGKQFLIVSYAGKNNVSPLEVEGINTQITTQEIIDIIKREREIH